MNLILVSWNGQNINNGSPFVSFFPRGSKVNLNASAITVTRSGNYPVLSNIVANPHTLTIGVNLGAGQNINTNREVLKKYFNFEDYTRHNLIAEDGSGGTQWYLTGFVRQVVSEGNEENGWIVQFQVEYPYWRLVTATDDSWTIAATGSTKTITNAGNRNVPPKFTFTPTTAKTAGYGYRRFVTVYNTQDVSFIAPLDITSKNGGSGGFDTATLTTAKMQADGDDLRWMVDGVEEDRWLNGMDTAQTQVWVNADVPPMMEGTSSSNVAASGAVASISFAKTRANKLFLEKLRQSVNRVFLIDSELFVYEAANVNLVTYQITSPTRAQKGTSEAAHTAPKTVRHIPHDAWILYGDSTLSAPDVNDENKPMIALTSENDLWTYSTFKDDSSARPAAWCPERISSRTGLSYLYTDDANDFVSPATEMGIALVGSTDFQVQNESGTLSWSLGHPVGFTSVTFSGRKYRSGSWPAIVGLQYLQTDAAWFTVDNQVQPNLPYTWQDFGPSTVSLGGTRKNIRFVIDGLLDSSYNALALIQFDTVSAVVATSGMPVATIGAEQVCNYFDFKVTNNATGEYILVTVPCGVNETVTIDCENKQAYLSDGGRVNVVLSTDRNEWLDAVPGSNTFQFDDVGTVAVTGHIIHRDRTL